MLCAQHHSAHRWPADALAPQVIPERILQVNPMPPFIRPQHAYVMEASDRGRRAIVACHLRTFVAASRARGSPAAPLIARSAQPAATSALFCAAYCHIAPCVACACARCSRRIHARLHKTTHYQRKHAPRRNIYVSMPQRNTCVSCVTCVKRDLFE